MILYVSDFDLKGSGYMNIGVSLCTQLTGRGYEVMALGLGYNGQEHYHPFKIVPTPQPSDVAPMVRQLLQSGLNIEALVVALDIPLQERIMIQLGIPSELPYIGIFPIEAGPLCQTWAMGLLQMDERLIMSRFGQEELVAAGVDSTYIPIGLDTESWRPPTGDERALLRRGLGADDDTFVVLTVADNQERKNLSRSLEIFADFAKDRNAAYWLVTRPKLPVGWKLEDYAMELGIFDRLAIWERGIAFKQLWSLYAAADAFLLTSKAEGLAMPVLEAMACRLPVVGTRCAAIEEHLQDGRGLLIEPDYVMVDPFGNSRRYFASREDGACKLANLADQPGIKKAMTGQALGYVQARRWENAGQVLTDAIERAKAAKVPVILPDKLGSAPQRVAA